MQSLSSEKALLKCRSGQAVSMNKTTEGPGHLHHYALCLSSYPVQAFGCILVFSIVLVLTEVSNLASSY